MRSFRLFQRFFSTVVLALPLFGYALTATAAGSSKNSFFLRPRDVVVFYGDSITALNRSTWPQNPVRHNYTYCVDIVSFINSHLPNSNISFYDMGVPGDTAAGDRWPDGGPANMHNPPDLTVDQRLSAVEALKPSVITINLGMNDGEYVDCNPADPGSNSVLYKTYTNGITHIIDTLLDWSRHNNTQLRLVVISPEYFDNNERALCGWSFPWHETPAANYNETLISFGQWEKSYVARMRNPNVTYIDINKPMSDANSRLSTGQSVTQEGIHPTEQGYEVIASAILSAWNAGAVESKSKITWPLHDGGSAYTVWPSMHLLSREPADSQIASINQEVESIRNKFQDQYDAIMNQTTMPPWH